jgi:hypothetical protein
MTGWYLLWPLIVAAGALLYRRLRQPTDLQPHS